MTLINGRGQLGEELKKIECDTDCYIYHTWNHVNKSEGVQRKEYSKFMDFVDNNYDKKIVFISTSGYDYNEYLKYKMLAEIYLWDHTKNGKVIRISCMLGKGVCEKIKDGYTPFPGRIELSLAKDNVEKIIDLSKTDSRLDVIHGQDIDIDLVSALIGFGND